VIVNLLGDNLLFRSSQGWD